MIALRRAVLGALAVAVPACGACHGDGAATADVSGPIDPNLARLPAAILPVGPRLAVDDGGYGFTIGASLYFRTGPSSGDRSRELPETLVTVAALPDRVVIVYPSATHDGLDLTQGGIDLPWTTEPFLDVKRQTIAAIDAIADRDGNVRVAVRDFTTRAITLATWRPGTPVTTETVPAPTTGSPRTLFWDERCPDLALGVTGTGDLDLVFSQSDSASRLFIAHRTRASGAWSLAQIDATDELGRAASTNGQPVLGCRSQIAYDERDLPTVLSLTRTIPFGTPDTAPSFSPDKNYPPYSQFDVVPRMVAQGYYVGGDGRWRRGGPVVSRDYGAPDWWMGMFALDTHPEGFVLAGTTVSDREPQVSVIGSTFASPLDALPRFTQNHNPTAHPAPDGYGFAQWGDTTAITRDPCGGITAYGLVSEPYPALGFTLAHAEDCTFAPRAPVMRNTAVDMLPVFAHGPRPYDVAICIYDPVAPRFAVCAGGWPLALDPPSPSQVFDDPAREIHVGASVPADGAQLAVPPTELVITLDRPLDAGENATIEVRSLASGTRVQITGIAGPHPAELHVPYAPTAPPIAGSHYRVSVDARGGNAPAHITLDQPAFTFQLAPDRVAVDRRFTAETLGCPTGSGTLGTDHAGPVCVGVQQPNALVGGTLALWLPDDPKYPMPVPHLEDPSGAVISQVHVIDPNPLTEDPDTLVWDVALAAGTQYTVVYPVGTLTPAGALVPDTDLRRAFVTQ